MVIRFAMRAMNRWLVFWIGIQFVGSVAAAQFDFSIPSKELSKLSIADPAAYRDLAEECSVVRKSKVAKNLAVRLYLIAAKHGDEKIRRSALRGMIHVARSDEELRKFKVLAFLNDPVFADLLLKKQNKVPTARKQNSPTRDDAKLTPRENLLDALVSIRRGKSLRAQRLMQSSDVQKLFSQFDDLMSVEEFNAACLQSDIDDATLYRIITIDLKLRYGDDSSEPLESDAAWRKVFEGTLPDKIPRISFDTVTEFNPDHSRFFNGRWQTPNG